MAKKKAAPKVSTAARRAHRATTPPRSHPAEVAVAPEPAESAPLEEEPEQPSNGLFPIVGIGASAGGLEAFSELLQTLPEDTGMAYVFVQHLDPRHVSLLTGLLQRHTGMPVLEASDQLKVEPNHVYVIPRNAHMNVNSGVLSLSPRHSSPQPHMSIDPFLRSLAADQKSKAIGVILSGSASDGSLGMMAIKASGGITFAQSSDTAKYDGMPRSAVAAGCIDFVLSPRDIGRELARLGHHPYIAPAASRESNKPDSASGEVITRILALLRNATGVDFSYYKPTTIQRRILRRMALQRVDNLNGYINKLRSDSAEVHALYEDILINVTEFFRDPEVFERLKKVVFPKMDTSHRAGPIRIWAPGCSSGEEVYSIAMALIEFLEERSHDTGVQIFGTDISESALDKARAGVYPASIAHDIPPDRMRRFFTKVNSSYQINKRIREMCIFAKQNLTRDPPFSKLDLISCRNVLIYLGPVLQKRILRLFHYGLKPNGFLLLGSSETIGSHSDLFTMEDKSTKIYLRSNTAVRALPLDLTPRAAEADKSEAPAPAESWTETELLREADRIVLGKYAPVGVVVDDEFNVVQFRGHTSPYLEHSPGMASFNVLKMARQGLSVELGHALQKARRENAPIRQEGLRVRLGSSVVGLNFEVIPFKKAAGRELRYLVLFEEVLPDTEPPAEKKPAGRPTASATERENAKVRQELANTREYLQLLIEEHESANEELRSANEEIQSSNEELQSTNEELETAKEELQSTNEELNTLNEELQSRNAQLAQTGNDLLNLLGNVNIPIVMLGNDLRIRRFTPVCQRVLNLIATDVGRPIGNINLNLEIARLDRVLAEVIETLTPKNLEVKDFSGRSYSLRIRPYRTEDNKIDGVVMVLVDIDPVRIEANALVTGELSTTELAERRSEELRAFTAGLLLSQERERNNLAMELHDDFSQRLALLELSVETMERTPPSKGELQTELRTFREQIGSLSHDLRRVAYQLHPSSLENLGLVAALESYCRTFGEREHISVKFQATGAPAHIDANTSLGLYRIMQESLHNVASHSGAQTVQVTLSGNDTTLQLSIKDTGLGFIPAVARTKGGLGIRSMEERARLLGGSLRIISEPGGGAELTAVVLFRPQTASEA
jgi:two-component system CheB/CheR fusion protein